jgi:hypothetical protein
MGGKRKHLDCHMNKADDGTVSEAVYGMHSIVLANRFRCVKTLLTWTMVLSIVCINICMYVCMYVCTNDASPPYQICSIMMQHFVHGICMSITVLWSWIRWEREKRNKKTANHNEMMHDLTLIDRLFPPKAPVPDPVLVPHACAWSKQLKDVRFTLHKRTLQCVRKGQWMWTCTCVGSYARDVEMLKEHLLKMLFITNRTTW